MSEKSFTVTESRLRAMAKECPEVEKALKKGFPEAFKGEEPFIEEEVNDLIEQIIERCQGVSCVGSGNFVPEKVAMARNRYLIYRILNQGIRSTFLERNNYLQAWLKEEKARRYKERK